MSAIIVSPLARIAEMAVRHGASEMVSLMGPGQDFHRPGVISKDRHLLLGMNDIAFAGTGDLIAPAEAHVAAIIDFAKSWNRAAPLLIHCWMGVSRSPAAALITSLVIHPEEEDAMLARRLRAASPYVTPNVRLVEIGDAMLNRNGRLIAAVKAIGRGADADGNAPFILPLYEPGIPHA